MKKSKNINAPYNLVFIIQASGSPDTTNLLEKMLFTSPQFSQPSPLKSDWMHTNTFSFSRYSDNCCLKKKV